MNNGLIKGAQRRRVPLVYIARRGREGQTRPNMHPSSQGLHNSGVRRLRVEVCVEQEGVGGRPPGILMKARTRSERLSTVKRGREIAYGVADTPAGYGHAALHCKTRLDQCRIVVGGLHAT